MVPSVNKRKEIPEMNESRSAKALHTSSREEVVTAQIANGKRLREESEQPDTQSSLKERNVQPINLLDLENQVLSSIKIGEIQKAISLINQILKIDPNRFTTLAMRGDIYRVQRKYDLALADLNAALVIEPKNVLALGARGDVYRLQGKYNLALADFNANIVNQPDNLDLLIIRANLYLLLERDDLALADINKILLQAQLAPPGDAAFALKIEIYLRHNKLEESCSMFLAIKDSTYAKEVFEKLITAARTQRILPDPTHPFYEILQSLTNYRKELGADANISHFFLEAKDKGTVTEGAAGSAVYQSPVRYSKYEDIYKFILAMQDISQHLKFIKTLDNKQDFRTNLAIQYVISSTGLFPHLEIQDHPDELVYACELLQNCFEEAKEKGKLLEFFQQAFNEKNACFKGRISTLVAYKTESIAPSDFAEDFPAGLTDQGKINEYFKVFRNKQIKKMAEDRHLVYPSFREQIVKGTASPQENNDFFQSYCTQAQFLAYLQENSAGQKIIDLLPALIEFFSA